MAVVIPPGCACSSGDVPRNHARIGYDNVLRDASWSATSAASDYPPEALANEMTVRRWRGLSSSASVTANFSQAPITYVGIAGHNLGDKNISISLDGSLMHTFKPADNSAIMMLIDKTRASTLEVSITGGEPPEIGALFAGSVLEMERPFFSGHTPAKLARTTVTRPRKSESGQYLSMTRRRRGYETSASWRHLSDQWYRDNFDPFVEHATTRPFFFAWNPEEHPEDCVYAWTSDEIRPAYMGIQDLIEVNMSMQAHGD